MNRRLIRHGVMVVLLGTLTGFSPMLVRNPRMGLAAHLEGILNGLLLIGLGAVWSSVRLGAGKERVAFGALVWAAYANWAITLSAAVTGAREFAPLAGAGFGAGPAVEKVTLLLILSVAVSILLGLSLVLAGLAGGE